jgi:hypothetical protein
MLPAEPVAEANAQSVDPSTGLDATLKTTGAADSPPPSRRRRPFEAGGTGPPREEDGVLASEFISSAKATPVPSLERFGKQLNIRTDRIGYTGL